MPNHTYLGPSIRKNIRGKSREKTDIENRKEYRRLIKNMRRHGCEKKSEKKS
jgi:hypothetical protein